MRLMAVRQFLVALIKCYDSVGGVESLNNMNLIWHGVIFRSETFVNSMVCDNYVNNNNTLTFCQMTEHDTIWAIILI